jgi:hypothetical protein
MILHQKPPKKTKSELFDCIEQAIDNKNYVFTQHGEIRSKQRKNVNHEQVIRILKDKYKKHDAARDYYQKGQLDWNYHIQGKTVDNQPVRIVLSFDENWMLIITVIDLT